MYEYDRISRLIPKSNPWLDALRSFNSQLGVKVAAVDLISLLKPYWDANRATAVQDALASPEIREAAQIAAARHATNLARPRRFRTTPPATDEPVLNLGENAGQGYYEYPYTTYRHSSPRRASPRLSYY